MNRLSKETLKVLPKETREQVKSALTLFNDCDLYWEYGRYHVMTGCVIKSSYGEDHEYLGTYYQEDVYTEEERRQNSVENSKGDWEYMNY